jgi:hypothetical protein
MSGPNFRVKKIEASKSQIQQLFHINPAQLHLQNRENQTKPSTLLINETGYIMQLSVCDGCDEIESISCGVFSLIRKAASLSSIKT